MLFNSYTFWAFFAIVVVLNRLLPHRGQNRMLLVASYVFYGFWDWRFLSLIFFSTVVDYFVAGRIESSDDSRRRKRFLVLSLSANLGVLGFFKYFDFFAREMANLLHLLGISVPVPVLDVVLPVGISFYTFQTLSYTIDVYRGRTQPIRGFLDFALYVSFFPQLVAGPIERSFRLLPQIVSPRKRASSDFAEGLYYVVMGLFKKVVIADNLAPIVTTIFASDAAELSGSEVLVGLYAFAFQIYGDFSGYSFIAKGVARWLGFDLMTNFDAPYFSASIREFWRRWHISLSTWLRDYLYISIGGNRRGRRRTYLNLMITMVLGGLWHGAAWTFVAWGVFHGAVLCCERVGEERGVFRKGGPASPVRRWIGMVTTFHLVCLGWLLFRAESLAQVGSMLSALLFDFSVTPFAVSCGILLMFYTGPMVAFEWWVQEKDDELALTHSWWFYRGLVYSYAAAMLWFFPARVAHEFIYFQF